VAPTGIGISGGTGYIGGGRQWLYVWKSWVCSCGGPSRWRWSGRSAGAGRFYRWWPRVCIRSVLRKQS
jgi:hypothetical protein